VLRSGATNMLLFSPFPFSFNCCERNGS
jgi:hypothetical protein